jgi:hypothetical protein
MTDWQIEGEWYKNCNCDPGCPCDFNQRPTKGYCEGLAAMRITKGYFGDVDLAGVKWGGVVRWPGPIHEGNGEIMPFVDSETTEEQRNAIFEIASGRHGDTFMEVFSFVCPTVHQPVVAPIEWEFDLEARSGRIRVGDGVLETEVETLRGISPPEPYRILVRIPDGMEYTGPDDEAETALATRIVSHGPIEFEIENGHSSMALVRHGSDIRTGKHEPIVVDKAFD